MITITLYIFRFLVRDREVDIIAENEIDAADKLVETHDDKELYGVHGIPLWSFKGLVGVADTIGTLCLMLWLWI